MRRNNFVKKFSSCISKEKQHDMSYIFHYIVVSEECMQMHFLFR